MLVHYDLQKPVVLHVDASGMGLGAVLLQRQSNGELQPISFMSRKLTPTESRYAQIEREALAVVFGVTKFNQYLMGRKFTIKTDHRPLVKLLGCHESIPCLASIRIKRWAMMLSAYDYDIQYLVGKENVYADFLSRQPVMADEPSDNEKVTVQVLLVESGEIIKAHTVKTETENDPILKKVLNYVQNGWPMDISEEIRPYYQKRVELSIEDGILLWNERVVIPASLRMILLHDLHAEHFGIVKMKQVARRYLWWPSIIVVVDQEIETTAKQCTQCQENAKQPTKKTGIWSWSNGPWKRLHVDFAGPTMGKMFLVVVDSYSKFLEIIPMSHATSTTTINALRHLFSLFGIPEHLVSDNGSQFTSAEFKEFLTKNGIIHTLTAPGHPATNGLAERYVGLFKNKMAEFGSTGETIQQRLDRFLLSYRTTPTSNGRSPSELLMNRQPRIRFNALRSSSTKQQVKVFEDSLQTPTFSPGNAVFALNFGRGPRWVPAMIIHVHSPYSYDVQVDGEVIWKRHRDQLRPRTVTTSDCTANIENRAQQIQHPPIDHQPTTSLESTEQASLSTNEEEEEELPEDNQEVTEHDDSQKELRRSQRTSTRPQHLIESC